jgi:hypothetical protein
MLRKSAPANQPTRDELESVCAAAQAITWHIRRYWSIDGQPLAKPEVGTTGDANGMRRAADMLVAVESQRNGTYPGPIIEWQLRELVFDWLKLNVGRFLFVPNILTPFPALLPTEMSLAMRHAVFPDDAWSGWGEHIPIRLRDAAMAVATIVHPILRRGVPESFASDDLDLLDDAVKQLREAIAFVESDLQDLILSALDGKAMTRDGLCWALRNGENPISTETLYGKRGRGGLKELIDLGIVKNDRKIGGYYRPLAPPARGKRTKGEQSPA